MTIYAENLKQVMIKLMKRLESEYYSLIRAELKEKIRDRGALDDLGKGISALHHIANSEHARKSCDPEPIGRRSSGFEENWLNLALRELREFNRNGVEYINSCTEAVIKSFGVINWLQQGSKKRKMIFYRGEHARAQYCKNLGPEDFKPKTVNVGKKKLGKRVYLKDSLTKEMVNELFAYFETKFYIPRVKRGKKQELETLINEEAFLRAR